MKDKKSKQTTYLEDREPLMAADSQAVWSYSRQSYLIEAARAGVSRSSLTQFLKKIERSLATIAEILPASYSLLTKRQVYDTKTSEHILELAQLYEYGIDVFGDINKLNTWLDTPAPSLGVRTPFSLLDTSFGIALVRVELQKIDYALPA